MLHSQHQGHYWSALLPYCHIKLNHGRFFSFIELSIFGSNFFFVCLFVCLFFLLFYQKLFFSFWGRGKPSPLLMLSLCFSYCCWGKSKFTASSSSLLAIICDDTASFLASFVLSVLNNWHFWLLKTNYLFKFWSFICWSFKCCVCSF